MKRIVQRSVSLLMAVLLVSFSFVSGQAFTANAGSMSSLGVRNRSKSEIVAYLTAHPFSNTEKVTFSSAPSITYPFALGAISSSSKTNGLNALNCYRYVAGLSAVTWNSDWNDGLQAASLVSALNGSINHHPSKPALLDQATYNLGYEYCGSSNLARNYKNLAASVAGYMDDSSTSNISRVGHRRWCLNPSMGKTGFGFIYGEDNTSYSAMYAFDKSNSADAGIVNVAWPAQNTPIEFFSGSVPWSLSTGVTLNSLSVSVQLTRVSDNKTWRFSSFSSDGYFNVDNDNYGLKGCIIFRPDSLTVNSGDTFQVRVETGESTVEYKVNFFKTDAPGSDDDPGSDEPTDPDDGPSDFDVAQLISSLVRLSVSVLQFFGKIGKWLLNFITGLLQKA